MSVFPKVAYRVVNLFKPNVEGASNRGQIAAACAAGDAMIEQYEAWLPIIQRMDDRRALSFEGKELLDRQDEQLLRELRDKYEARGEWWTGPTFPTFGPDGRVLKRPKNLEMLKLANTNAKAKRGRFAAAGKSVPSDVDFHPERAAIRARREGVHKFPELPGLSLLQNKSASAAKAAVVRVLVKRGGQMVNVAISAAQILLRHKTAFGRPANEPLAETKKVIAGRSPRSGVACDRMLAHAFESGQGIFQFLPSIHTEPHARKPAPALVDHLHARLAQYGPAGKGKALIGGRYRLAGIEEVRVGAFGYRCYQVTAHDMEDMLTPKIIYLTQAPTRRGDTVLPMREIERAHAAMTAHVGRNFARDGAHSAVGPTLLSPNGGGPNLALAIYGNAIGRLHEITELREVSQLLRQIVKEGQRSYGPKFRPSDRQYQELQSAVMDAFCRHRARQIWIQHTKPKGLLASALKTRAAAGAPARVKKQVRFAMDAEPGPAPG